MQKRPTRMRVRRPLLVCALFSLAIAIALSAQTTPSALERYKELRAQLQKDHKQNDWKTDLEHAKELRLLLNASPRSLLEVARAELKSGHEDEAWTEVERFLSMGQANDILTAADFAGLQPSTSHPDITAAMKKNLSAVGLSETAFVLSDAGLVAEDIDYDAAAKRFYLTSVLKKKIIAVDANGNAKDFVESPDHWPMLALKLDTKRSLLWATEVALDGFSAAPKSDWGHSAVLGYDLKTAKIRYRIPGPSPSALGDMALAENGDPIVSDGQGGGIYRVHVEAGRLERIDGGDFISPQTGTLSSDGKRIFIPDYLRGIGALDLATRQVTWLSGESHALDGVDGLYFANGVLLATQNGTSPERVVALGMDGAGLKVVGEQVIERATATLGDPTHGVVVGSDFYYIANSGWDKLDDHGDLSPGQTHTPARIMRVSLSALHPN